MITDHITFRAKWLVTQQREHDIVTLVVTIVTLLCVCVRVGSIKALLSDAEATDVIESPLSSSAQCRPRC